MSLVLEQILGGDETKHGSVCLYEWKFLDLVGRHHTLGLGEGDGTRMNDELVEASHAIRHPYVGCDKPYVASGQQSLEPVSSVHDNERSDAGPLHHAHGIGETLVFVDPVRIANDAVLRPLHARHLCDLRRDITRAEATVDDPDSTLFGEDCGHRRPRDRVHVGRHQRTFDRNALREAGRQIDDVRIAAWHHAELRSQQEVVECAAANELKEIHSRHRSKRLSENTLAELPASWSKGDPGSVVPDKAQI